MSNASSTHVKKRPSPLRPSHLPPRSPPNLHHLAPLVIPATPPGDPLSGLEDSMRKPIMRKRRGSAPAILSPIFTSSNTSVSLPALKNPSTTTTTTTTTSTTKKKTKTKETQRKNEVQQQESTTSTTTTPAPPKKRSASARRLRIATTSPPAAHAAEEKAVQIPRKHFQVVHAI